MTSSTNDGGAESGALFAVERAKAVDPAAALTDIRVEEKTGGKTGRWVRNS